MPYTFGDEAFLIKWTALIKKEVLNIDPKPAPDEVLFINTALSKLEIDVFDDPLSLTPRKVKITNREKLAELLDLISQFNDNIKLIVVDLIFDYHTSSDSILQSQFNELGNKILAAKHIAENDSVIQPVLSVPSALATYRSAAGMYFKYPVVYKQEKTLPTVIYEKLSGKIIEKKKMFYRDADMFSLKSPITDFKVRMNDFQLGDDLEDSNYAIHHLETLTQLGRLMEPEDLRKMFEGKIIMIGDFENDVHKTAFGMMPGLLIVFNAYLTLANHDNVITFSWLLLMILGFSWISYRILTGKGFNLLHLFKQRFKSGWIHFIIDSLDELFFLSILTILSYLLFNIHINILVLFIYLKLIEFVYDIIKNKYNFEL